MEKRKKGKRERKIRSILQHSDDWKSSDQEEKCLRDEGYALRGKDSSYFGLFPP